MAHANSPPAATPDSFATPTTSAGLLRWTGARELHMAGPPRPRTPQKSKPQHLTLPPAVSAQVRPPRTPIQGPKPTIWEYPERSSPPAEICTSDSATATSAGVRCWVVLVVPSCPSSFSPQHFAAPEPRSAHVWP